MDRLLDGGTFFEGPRWHDGRWFVSDFYSHRVLAVTVDGEAETVMEVPAQPSGLGWMPDGSLLAVSMTDQRVLRRAPGGDIAEHADLAAHCRGYANDMVVDRAGRAYVGNMGFDHFGGEAFAPTHLLRVDPDGTVVPEGSDLQFPNGMVITADGATLIVCESFAGRLTAFDVGPAGALSGRRTWAQLGGNSGDTRSRVAPDGCAIDAEGHVWVADARGGRVCRVAPGGEVVDERRDPGGLKLYACMLGGADGRTLLCCAAPSSRPDERAAAAEAVLLTNEVDVPRGDGLP